MHWPKGRGWKILGLGFGVAATRVVIARAERRRRAYTPEEIRDRLHARLAEAEPVNRRERLGPSVANTTVLLR